MPAEGVPKHSAPRRTAKRDQRQCATGARRASQRDQLRSLLRDGRSRKPSRVSRDRATRRSGWRRSTAEIRAPWLGKGLANCVHDRLAHVLSRRHSTCPRGVGPAVGQATADRGSSLVSQMSGDPSRLSDSLFRGGWLRRRERSESVTLERVRRNGRTADRRIGPRLLLGAISVRRASPYLRTGGFFSADGRRLVGGTGVRTTPRFRRLPTARSVVFGREARLHSRNGRGSPPQSDCPSAEQFSSPYF